MKREPAEEEHENVAPPSPKRQRLSPSVDLDQAITTANNNSTQIKTIMAETTAEDLNGAISREEEVLQKEVRAGITEFVNPKVVGFVGVLKQRYSDFLVNEILPDGRVLHLMNLAPPSKKKKKAVASEMAAEDGVKNEAELEDDIPIKGRSDESIVVDLKSEDVGEQAQSAQLVPDPPLAIISEADEQTLRTIFGDRTFEALKSLHKEVFTHPKKKTKDFNKVESDIIDDKQVRTNAHQAVRRIFNFTLQTTTNEATNTILIKAAPMQTKTNNGSAPSRFAAPRQGRNDWADLGGEYVHFTIYKENKDTMESIFFLSSQMKVNVKRFQFGGTKDRRAVTVQRASAFRINADQLANIGKRLRNAKIGDFAYSDNGLELGELGGNEFVITLRNCRLSNEDGQAIDALSSRSEALQRHVYECVNAFQRGGYINYFGLQRFGSFSTGTDAVGTLMLQGLLKEATDAILEFNPSSLAEAQNPGSTTTLIGQDDKDRAEAIDIWKTTGKSSAALAKMPRKFSAELNIIRHLGQKNHRGDGGNANDFQGALMTIPRNLRLMYVHAYQSLVWNVVVGERWKLFGDKVVEGDLVVVEKINVGPQGTTEPDVDQTGEPIIRPAAEDSAITDADQFVRARPITAAETASGKFNIFDVVLPLPGFDVIYPPNAVEEVYKTFMASPRGGGLDPYNMRRSWKDVSLSGGYRKVMSRPVGPVEFEVKAYLEDNEQLVETDLERLENRRRTSQGFEPVIIKREESGVSDAEVNSKLAVVLKMQLGPSQYATMALRELMGAANVTTYKPDYGGGR